MIFVGRFRKEEKNPPFNNYLQLNKQSHHTASSSNFTSGLIKSATVPKIYRFTSENTRWQQLESGGARPFYPIYWLHSELLSSADNVDSIVIWLSKSVFHVSKLIEMVI